MSLNELYNHEFSAIGLAETNTDEPLKDLYNIPNYTGHYQNTQENKHKGTGVALYVHNCLNVDVLENVSKIILGARSTKSVYFMKNSSM